MILVVVLPLQSPISVTHTGTRQEGAVRGRRRYVHRTVRVLWQESPHHHWQCDACRPHA